MIVDVPYRNWIVLKKTIAADKALFGQVFHRKILSFKIVMSVGHQIMSEVYISVNLFSRGYVTFILQWKNLSIMLLSIFSSPVRSTRRAIVVTPVVHVCVSVSVPVTLC